MHECFKFVVTAVQTRLGIKKDCSNHAYMLNILLSKKISFFMPLVIGVLTFGGYIPFQEAIVTSEEVGKDFEHVEAQQKKFDDFEKVFDNDSTRLAGSFLATYMK